MVNKYSGEKSLSKLFGKSEPKAMYLYSCDVNDSIKCTILKGKTHPKIV